MLMSRPFPPPTTQKQPCLPARISSAPLPFCHKPSLSSPMTKRRSDLTLKPPLSVLPHPAPGALPAPAHAIPTTAPMPQLPPPTLDALPGPAHAIVATMLPNGDQARNRLRLSLVSRSMLGFHGGTLTVLGVRSITDQQAATLASLVQRQRSLERLCFEDSETFPVVTTILTQGALRRVRELILELPPKGTYHSTRCARTRRSYASARGPRCLGVIGFPQNKMGFRHDPAAGGCLGFWRCSVSSLS